MIRLNDSSICFAVSSVSWIVSDLLYRTHCDDSEEARRVHSFCFAFSSIMYIGSIICVLIDDA